MAKITDNTGKEVSEGSVVMAYFRKPGQSATEFFTELKALTPEDKTELAIGAAKELGYTVTQ